MTSAPRHPVHTRDRQTQRMRSARESLSRRGRDRSRTLQLVPQASTPSCKAVRERAHPRTDARNEKTTDIIAEKAYPSSPATLTETRSEERRVGEEWRYGLVQ